MKSTLFTLTNLQIGHTHMNPSVKIDQKAKQITVKIGTEPKSTGPQDIQYKFNPPTPEMAEAYAGYSINVLNARGEQVGMATVFDIKVKA